MAWAHSRRSVVSSRLNSCWLTSIVPLSRACPSGPRVPLQDVHVARNSLSDIKDLIGKELGVFELITVTQKTIDSLPRRRVISSSSTPTRCALISLYDPEFRKALDGLGADVPKPR